jgi:hypothetical protein
MSKHEFSGRISHTLWYRGRKKQPAISLLHYTNGRRTCRVSARSVLKINYLCAASLSLSSRPLA